MSAGRRAASLERGPVADRGGLRILVTVDGNEGRWRYATELAGGLARLGIETVIAGIGQPPSAALRDAKAAAPAATLVETGLTVGADDDGPALRIAAEAIRDLAMEHAVDIVQLDTAALAAQVRFPVPVVAVQHDCVATWWEAVHGTSLPEDHVPRTEPVRAGLQAADVVVTPTSTLADSIRRRYGLRSAPRSVHEGRTPRARAVGSPHDFVLTAGRLWDEAKNLRALDSAAARIAVPVHAAGPIEGAGGAVVFDNIHGLGTLEEAELGRWLAARPVFVSSSLYEPFGLSVLAAAAAGCPLILSDIPTFRELWDGVALFVPPRDEAAFRCAIANLVGDDFERAVLGHGARERASRYTADAMAAQMASIYRGLLPAVRRPVLASRAA